MFLVKALLVFVLTTVLLAVLDVYHLLELFPIVQALIWIVVFGLSDRERATGAQAPTPDDYDPGWSSCDTAFDADWDID